MVLALGLSGCSKPAPPRFALNTEGRIPQSVRPDQATAITKALETLYGTPDNPKVPLGVDLNAEALAAAAGPIGGDAQGNQRGLFRRHCVMCHGVSGDGAGPAAQTCMPYYPRDFRNGTFKYSSTRGGAKPLGDDLRRTLLRGLNGTSMPSFLHLRTEEIDALIEYVKYLAVRGQTELYLMQLVVDGDAPLPLSIDEILEDAVLPAANAWKQPEADRKQWVVAAPPPPSLASAGDLTDSIAQGRALYTTKEAQCVKCHGPQGDGQGEDTELYDDWNKPKKGVTPEETEKLAARFRLPLVKLRPRDFRQGIFHGGASPQDIYLRIAVGIKGTPMPGTVEAPGVKAVLQPDEIWLIVRYVLSLSDPGLQAQARLTATP